MTRLQRFGALDERAVAHRSEPLLPAGYVVIKVSLGQAQVGSPESSGSGFNLLAHFGRAVDQNRRCGAGGE
jgi:hypothetical protein